MTSKKYKLKKRKKYKELIEKNEGKEYSDAYFEEANKKCYLCGNKLNLHKDIEGNYICEECIENDEDTYIGGIGD